MNVDRMPARGFHRSKWTVSPSGLAFVVTVLAAVGLVGCGASSDTDQIEDQGSSGPSGDGASVAVGLSDEQMLDLHRSIQTIDTHDDIPFDFATPAADPGTDSAMQIDIPKMERGALDVGFFVVYVGQTERTEANIAKAKADAMIKFDAIHRMTKQYGDRIELASQHR